MTLRILGTGSRAHPEPAKVEKILEVFCSYAEAAYRWKYEPILVNGGCLTSPDDKKQGFKSVDEIFNDYAERFDDVHSEIHLAEWNKHGRAAGPIRNRKMVKLGADFCLGFPVGKSAGTRHCIREAQSHEIPTLIFEVDQLDYVEQSARMREFVQKNKDVYAKEFKWPTYARNLKRN